MTPKKIMEIALRNAGLTSSSSTWLENSREYLNIQIADVGAFTEWQWSRQTGTITTTSGTKTYSLGANVYSPMAFRNSTDNYPIEVQTEQWLDNVDPDQSETGNPRFVIPLGINSSTGYWEVMFHPTPNDSTTSIPYRYHAIIPELTISDDETDLAPKIPRHVQAALIHGVKAMHMDEMGDKAGKMEAFADRDELLVSAMQVEGRAHANKRTRLGRPARSKLGYAFSVQEGSLQ
tara:strand:+ start:127 stop:828 length:702 start_codon:yes stop_codon:yes gene_type:complete